MFIRVYIFYCNIAFNRGTDNGESSCTSNGFLLTSYFHTQHHVESLAACILDFVLPN